MRKSCFRSPVYHDPRNWAAEELPRQHPDLRPEELYAALAFFYDHYEIVAQMNRQEDEPTSAHVVACRCSGGER
jgi:hypothetical protein